MSTGQGTVAVLCDQECPGNISRVRLWYIHLWGQWPKEAKRDEHHTCTWLGHPLPFVRFHRPELSESFGVRVRMVTTSDESVWWLVTVNDWLPCLFADCRVSLIFGVITCAAGICGVTLGLYSASLLRKVTPKADPLVCGIGLIAGAPFLYLAIVMSSHDAILTWVRLSSVNLRSFCAIVTTVVWSWPLLLPAMLLRCHSLAWEFYWYPRSPCQ